MELNKNDFNSILNSMDDLLNKLTERQKILRTSIREKNWETLTEVIKEINLISNYFTEVDDVRDQIQNTMSKEELSPYLGQLRILRSKLLKCKVENKVLEEYVTITRQFIQEVVDQALPRKGNKYYSRDGSITQPQMQSVLVDLRG